MKSGARILYIQYTNPAGYPPLEHSSRILARKGWAVLFLGVGAYGGADLLRFPPHDRITVRQIRFRPAGWQQKMHYLRYCFWVLYWTLIWRPSWVYVSDPLATPIGLVLSYLPGLRLVYHEHDSPQPHDSGSRQEISSFMRLVMWTRRQLAGRVHSCVLPNEQRAERFDIQTGRSTVQIFQSPLVVWNCPSVDEISEPRAAYDGEDLWVLYQGSIVPPRLPTTVLRALAILPATVKLRVIGYETIGHKGYLEELRKSACELGVSSRVEILNPAMRRDLLNWCHKCDIGLAFMPMSTKDINQEAMIGASNKPFDYLACGLALLVSDLPEWRLAYVEPGYGLACDPSDSESIANALSWFIDHPDEMRRMGERGRQKIFRDWNYEDRFAPIYEILCSRNNRRTQDHERSY